MSKLKRLFAPMLAILIVAAVFFTLPLETQAATSGPYTYTVKNGKATITACDTSISGDITIPSEIDGYPVTAIGPVAFSSCSNITSVIIPESVTSIGKRAFEQCNSLTSVTLPSGITSISEKAFSYSGLKSIVIPKGVTSIGDYAFEYCGSLTEVTVPDGLQTVGANAFSYCESLKVLTLPDSVTSIGSYAFYYSGLTSMVIPSNVTTVENGLFCYCSNLTSVTLPDGITSIGGYAFDSCVNLISVNIPKSVTSIGIQAFAFCYSLTDISIPDGVTYIEGKTFLQCEKLSELTIGNNVPTIADSMFANCSNLTEVIIPDDVTSIMDIAFSDCYRITEVTIGKNVGYIGSYAFGGCDSLGRIILRSKVGNIHSHAFVDVISDVAYPKDVATWTSADFQNYGGELTWKPYGQPIILEQPVRYYGRIGTTATFTVKTDIDTGWPIYQWEYSTDYGKHWQTYTADDATTNQISIVLTNENVETMYRCHITDEISGKTVMSDEVQTRTPIIASGSYEPSTMAGAEMPEGSTVYWELTMNRTMFLSGDGFAGMLDWPMEFKDGKPIISDNSHWGAYMDSITRVVVEYGITEFQGCAFANLKNLREAYLADSVIKMGSYAFTYCEKLEKVDFSRNQINIAGYEFYGCLSLSEINLPSSIEWINELAFYDCPLTELVLPEGLVGIYTDAFYKCPITSIQLPSTLKYVSGFRGCNLTSIELPEGLETIGERAFQDCPIKTIDIPDTVHTIRGYAFAGTLIEELVLPDAMEYICGGTYDGQGRMEYLKSLTIGKNVNGIERGAFSECPNLTSITFQEGLESLGNSGYVDLLGPFADCNLEVLVLPDSLTIIGDTTFAGSLSNVTYIYIPKGLDTITGFLKECHALEEITIPANIAFIDENAFNDCESLTFVLFEGDPPIVRNNTFKNVEADMAYNKDLGTWAEYDFVNYQGKLTWRPYGQPIILEQPIRYYGRIGTTATFTVKTDIDDGFPEYQWQYSTDAGKTWQNYEAEDAKTAQINVTVTAENIGAMYRCVITDGICKKTATTEAAQIQTPVEITKQPADTCADSGEAYAAEVTVAGYKVTYQWYAKSASDTDFAQVNGSAAKYSATKANEDVQLYCVITDAFGNTATTETVTVKDHTWQDATCEIAQTCSDCQKTKGEPLGHKWVDATCETAKTCSVCKKTEGSALGHKWQDATCEIAKTCSVCQKTEGSALGHKWVDATCETAKTCSVCQKTEGSALGHKWQDATCETAKTCSVCKKTEGSALGHKWVDATCETAKTCSVCQKTEGSALGHKWVDATCETAKTCSVCQKTEGSALGHKWVDATCETAKTCSVCKKTDGAALGHKWVDATCETAKTCSVCNKTEGAALGHKWDGGTVTKPATEKETGVKTYTCTACGETKTETIPVLAHTHKYDKATVAATCEADGYDKYTCSCGDSYTDNVVKALGHKWDGGTVTKPATETETGVKTYKCIACGESKTETIPVLAHTHKYEKSTVAATCEADGYDKYTCSCGDSYTDNAVKALGHKWDGGTVTKPATEKETGVKTYKCTACGETKTETIPVLSHTHKYDKATVAATCEADGYDKYTCSCGDSYTDNVVKALGHKWADATCDKPKTCSVCNKTDGAALGHKYENGFCSVCGKEDIVASGSITATLTWKLDSKGVLTISGTGAMVFGGIQPKGENKMVFAGENAAPWAAYAAQIVRVVIEEGVTSIADNAFEECVKLEEVTVAATVEVVGESAFANCESLNEITFQGEAPELGANCFQGVSATVTHPVVDSWKEETLAGTGGEIVLEAAKPKLKKGDANGDGKVDYKDAMLVLRASVGLEKLDEDGKTAGDVDGNNKLDYKDAMKILRASVGLEEL